MLFLRSTLRMQGADRRSVALGSLIAVALAANGCSDQTSAPSASRDPVASGVGAGPYLADDGSVSIEFRSDATWSGQAVCLNAGNPAPCPAGAVLYGWPHGGWGTNISAIAGAQWIWGPGVTGSTQAYPARFVFSKSFELDGTPIAGSIRISADDSAEVLVNAVSVGSIGSTTNNSIAAAAHSSLHAFDLAPYLVTGTNVVTIIGTNGNFGTCAYSCNPAGLVFGGALSYQPEVAAAPVVTGVLLPAEPLAAGTVAPLGATFTDANAGDVHTGGFTWTSGTADGTVTEAGGEGTLAGSHTFTAPGVYTITASVSDGALSGSRSSALDTPAYLVIYDATGSFVTGGGWVLSPAGACRIGSCDELTAGRATFGFTSRYAKGATVPSGMTQFQFQAGDLQFTSTSYAWLVVAGARAQFKGEGTVNGAGGYGFLLTAIDGEISGGGGVDRFRIKIWEIATDAVVYDNQMGQPEAGDATTELGGGSIKLHR